MYFSQLLDVRDNYLSLMDDGGKLVADIKIPAGSVGKDIQEKYSSYGEDQQFLVTILSACGTDAAIAIKNMPY